MNGGWQLDDFLEIVECLPHEIRASFAQMTEKDKEVDGLSKSLGRQRQKLLTELQSHEHPASASLLPSKALEKLAKDEQVAASLLDEKISTCQTLISTLETYLPILQSEIQKSSSAYNPSLTAGSPAASVSRRPAQSPFLQRNSSPMPMNQRPATPLQGELKRPPSVDPARTK